MSIRTSPARKSLDRIRQEVLRDNGGAAPWRRWKAVQLEDLLSLARDAQARMTVIGLSIAGDFQALYQLRMPVPIMPPDGRLRVVAGAVFNLRYLDEWRAEAPPA